MRKLLAAFLAVMQPEVPPRLARWTPSFLLASPGQRAAMDRLRSRLR